MDGLPRAGADALHDALEAKGLKCIARVRESADVMDFAVATGTFRLCVIRCVERVRPTDYHALKTMLAQGDFSHAVLVYCGAEQPHLSDDIETLPIADAARLAAFLAAEDGAS